MIHLELSPGNIHLVFDPRAVVQKGFTAIAKRNGFLTGIRAANNEARPN
jgi:hypothetical protein